MSKEKKKTVCVVVTPSGTWLSWKITTCYRHTIRFKVGNKQSMVVWCGVVGVVSCRTWAVVFWSIPKNVCVLGLIAGCGWTKDAKVVVFIK